MTARKRSGSVRRPSKRARAVDPAARPKTEAPTPAAQPRVRRAAPALTPEDMLRRAMAANTSRSRSHWAKRGLGQPDLDPTTQAMLLRQLYLAAYERRAFDQAKAAIAEALELGVLPDVLHQDAARACVGQGDVEGALGHLRLAARIGPPSRRAFHYWTLGSLLFASGRHGEAASALSRAARWGTTDKPLYQGHLAVVKCAAGETVEDLASLIERLSEVPAGQGYGRFVLGQMAYYARRLEEARRHLGAFVERTSHGRAVMAIALEAELDMARATLAHIDELVGAVSDESGHAKGA